MAGRPKEFDRSAALGKALDCFWVNGYDGASLADLVEAMGIGRQSAYDTFGEKRQLFQAALDEYAKRITAHLTTILTDGPSPLGRVRRFLETLRQITVDGDGRGCLFTNSMVELGPRDPAVREFISRVWLVLEDGLAANLKAAVRAGELRDDLEPRAVARLLLTVMQGALVLSKAKLSDRVADATRTMELMLLR